MKTTDLFLRCYAEKKDELWVAVCIDLSLAAQSADPMDAIQKLNLQIADYVQEAFSEPEHTEQLLTRRAPFSHTLKYYSCKAKVMLCHFLFRIIAAPRHRGACEIDGETDVKVFHKSLPMAPAY